MHDCGSGLHLMPGTPLEFNLNLDAVEASLRFFEGELRRSAKCVCPAVTDEEVRRRFMPGSIEGLLSFFVHDKAYSAGGGPVQFQRDADSSAATCDNTDVLPATFDANTFWRTVVMRDFKDRVEQFGVHATETCTYARWKVRPVAASWSMCGVFARL